MKHLDLFSGIGGFALAADRVFGEVEHIFVEIDPFCQEVLKKHWPKAKIYDDIRTFTPDTDKLRCVHGEFEEQSTERHHETQCESLTSLDPPFILTGGFPCQPFSQAGKRKGTEDNRDLWPEMFRVIKEFKPTWVIGENVAGFVNMELERTASNLESEGYEVWPLIIPAVAKNAPHRRDRIWIIGYSEHTRLNGSKNRKSSIKGSDSNTEGQNENEQSTRPVMARDIAEDSVSKRSRGWLEDSGQVLGSGRTEIKNERPDWESHWFEVATELCRVDDGLPKRLDRNPRLKALGNAIVPQIAEEIFKAIKLSTDHTKVPLIKP
jgi:DNA (cytosine-5)-methyltransferase 1